MKIDIINLCYLQTKHTASQACHLTDASSQILEITTDSTDSQSYRQKCLYFDRPLLMEKPDIVVGTPSRLLAHLKAQNLTLKDTLEVLVIDEADLVFSYGYENDLKSLLTFLPKIYQAFLMSATLSDEVFALKKLVLHNPVSLVHGPFTSWQ